MADSPAGFSLSAPVIWVRAARPKTLCAAIAPVFLGTAFAIGAGAFHLPSALCALVAAVLIQIGTNYANDYQDFVQGADTSDRKGPMRMTQAGLVQPGAMKRATVIVFASAFLIGLYLVLRGGWPVLLVGCASILFGILYTTGRYSLAYLGVADLFVLVFFGPVAVAGTHYVQALSFSWAAAFAGLGPGFLATAILLVNNTRDVEEDRAAGKRTLVVRWGRSAGIVLYGVCIAGAGIVALVFALANVQGWVHLALLVTPFGVSNLVGMHAARDPTALNPLLGATSWLLLAYCLLFGAGRLL